LAIETRKANVVKEMGSLPGYHSLAHYLEDPIEEGEDYGCV
jgi:hypothetical protein